MSEFKIGNHVTIEGIETGIIIELWNDSVEAQCSKRYGLDKYLVKYDDGQQCSGHTWRYGTALALTVCSLPTGTSLTHHLSYVAMDKDIDSMEQQYRNGGRWH
jgi:hypothetical protein